MPRGGFVLVGSVSDLQCSSDATLWQRALGTLQRSIRTLPRITSTRTTPVSEAASLPTPPLPWPTVSVLISPRATTTLLRRNSTELHPPAALQRKRGDAVTLLQSLLPGIRNIFCAYFPLVLSISALFFFRDRECLFFKRELKGFFKRTYLKAKHLFSFELGDTLSDTDCACFWNMGWKYSSKPNVFDEERKRSVRFAGSITARVFSCFATVDAFIKI